MNGKKSAKKTSNFGETDMMQNSKNFFKYFKGLCVKRMCQYHVRSSETSSYIEITVGNKTYLFRFSDHQVSETHPWSPDFDVRDAKTFRAAKNFLKSISPPLTF